MARKGAEQRPRLLDMDLPPGQSAFLWGPRQTGKSTWLRQRFPHSIVFGRALEHYIFMELNAHRAYRELHYGIDFWRTKTGLEVDFILAGGEVALEVKGSSRIDKSDLKGLQAFSQEHNPSQAILVCNEPQPRQAGDIALLPWRLFLERLWDGQILR